MTKNCYACGQAMIEPVMENIHDQHTLHTILGNLEDYEWEYLEAGQDLDINFGNGITSEVIAKNTELSYDSYGSVLADDAYIVFTLSDGTDTQAYKIDGSNSSYEGWDWQTSRVRKVKATPKTV